MSEAVADTALSPAPRPDTLFGLVAGLYVAVLVVPAAGLLAWATLGYSAGVASLVVLGVGLVVVTVSTLVVTRVDGLAVRLGATPWRWAPAVAPGVPFVAALLVPPDPSPTMGALGLTGIGCLAVGYVLGLMSHTRYTAAMVDDESIESEWHARRSPTYRKRIGALAVGLVVAGFGTFGVSMFVEHYALRFAGQVLIPMAAGLVGAFQSTHYRARPTGLETHSAANRTLVSWSAFTGYSVTDEAVVVHHRYSLFSASFDREDVDTDVVVGTLDDHLDEQ